MIPDKKFKTIIHQCRGYTQFSNGNSIEPGYKPDYVLKKGSDYIILESENVSSRKTYVGGMIKAAHFLQGDKTGSLIFIIFPKPNTTAIAIAKHLKKYLNWINSNTNLRNVYVIESGFYFNNEIVIRLLSKQFHKFALKV